MQFHEPARMPRGFSCTATNCGLKQREPDLALFFSEAPGNAAAIFTRNQFPGAPVIVGRELIKGGRLQGVVVNSRVSNVGTGEAGIVIARRMGAAAAKELGVDANLILMSSTGVIGVPLPVEKIESGLQGLSKQLQNDPLVGARGIMTTDTHPKAVSLSVGDATITIVAKGAGMIEPNMATMLCYIFTDAKVESAKLDRMLRDCAHVSLNMLSIDSDTSTSDTCVVIANGLAGEVDDVAFENGLRTAMIKVAELLARDGEGATKLLRVLVRNAANEAEARQISKAIVNSPLVKTMAYGADPNVGRLLMAIGKNFEATIVRENVNGWINGIQVVTDGTRATFDDEDVRRILKADTVDIVVDLGVGEGSATAFGCDLTEGYINENAAYYSS